MPNNPTPRHIPNPTGPDDRVRALGHAARRKESETRSIRQTANITPTAWAAIQAEILAKDLDSFSDWVHHTLNPPPKAIQRPAR